MATAAIVSRSTTKRSLGSLPCFVQARKQTTTTSKTSLGTLAFHHTRNYPSLSKRFNMATSSSSSLDEAAKKALLTCPTITLRDGTNHPAIGFGVSIACVLRVCLLDSLLSNDDQYNNSFLFSLSHIFFFCSPRRTKLDSFLPVLRRPRRRLVPPTTNPITQVINIINARRKNAFRMRSIWDTGSWNAPNFTETKSKWETPFKKAECHETNCSFAAKCGRRPLKTDLRLFEHNWTKHWRIYKPTTWICT